MLFALCALILTSCNAQTTAISISNTVKGNTGHRGIIPKDEDYKPIEGKDYYNCTLTMNQNCTVEIVRLTVKATDDQVHHLSPKFDDGQTKKKVKKGDVLYLNVEKSKELTAAKGTIEGEGILLIKVNGRTKRIPIKEFRMVMPM